MSRRWTVLSTDEVITLELTWSGEASRATRADVAAWFGDYSGRLTLVEICSEIGSVEGYRTTTDELITRTLAAIERGDLRVRRTPRSAQVFARYEKDEAPEPVSERAPVEEKTWIGIRLMDDADPPQPVAYRRYKVELPDGSTREGMLDDAGRARLQGIDPGKCRVTFPDLDPNSWAAQ